MGRRAGENRGRRTEQQGEGGREGDTTIHTICTALLMTHFRRTSVSIVYFQQLQLPSLSSGAASLYMPIISLQGTHHHRTGGHWTVKIPTLLLRAGRRPFHLLTRTTRVRGRRRRQQVAILCALHHAFPAATSPPSYGLLLYFSSRQTAATARRQCSLNAFRPTFCHSAS